MPTAAEAAAREFAVHVRQDRGRCSALGDRGDMTAKQQPRTRHVPQRTCIACRRVAGKRALIRLVRTDAGVEVDATGKRAGRGMYLHPNQQCWSAALKGSRIEQALRTKLSAANRQALQVFAATLPASEELPPIDAADQPVDAAQPGTEA
jgi:predicted RNA-binding protein YlxR (DUF448 family)